MSIVYCDRHEYFDSDHHAVCPRCIDATVFEDDTVTCGLCGETFPTKDFECGKDWCPVSV